MKNSVSKVKAKAQGATSNPIKKSLIKVVVPEDKGKWLSPEKLSVHRIDEDANLPMIDFRIDTDFKGVFKWKWKISWEAKVSGLSESGRRGSQVGKFSVTGVVETPASHWACAFDGVVLGGVLTVEVLAGKDIFLRTVYIKGSNPSRQKLDAFVGTLDEASGYEKILHHEAKGKQFINVDGEPVVAFDKGYGLAQLTQPAPSYEQAWNWKANVKAGLALFHLKRKDARTYLSKHGKDSFSEEQLQLETFSRYNGGAYHQWDAKGMAWVRRPNILCDDATGNIGWNTADSENKDKSADELHQRDASSYGKGLSGQSKEHSWVYTGVCYADHIAEE